MSQYLAELPFRSSENERVTQAEVLEMTGWDERKLKQFAAEGELDYVIEDGVVYFNERQVIRLLQAIQTLQAWRGEIGRTTE